MADTLESLEIEVRHSATGAADEINRVAEAIRSVSRAISRALPNMIAFHEAMGGSAINLTTNNVTQVADNIANIRTVAVHARQATNDASRGINDMARAASKAKGPLDNFVSSLKRIAFYRFIRSIIKAITKAFSEGLEWAYKFSAAIAGEGHRFAEALDSMKSASTQMKAQLGSAFAALLTLIEPVLERIIAVITRVADAMSQFFAVFTGGTYLKATETSQQFADTMAKGGKAAKEWKNQLMGFDEINRLNEPSNGGGSRKNEIDPSELFKETPIDGFFKKLKDYFDDLKKSLDFTALSKSWNVFKDSVKAFAELVGSALLWVWNNVLIPLAHWTIEKAAPVVLELLANAFEFFRTVLEKLQPVFQWIWDNIFVPLAEWTGEIIIKALQGIADLLKDLTDLLNGNKSFKEFINDLSGWQTFLVAVAVAVVAVYTALGIYNAVAAISTLVTGGLSTAMSFLAANPIVLVIAAIALLVVGIIQLIKHWDTVKAAAISCWEAIKYAVSSIGAMISNVINGIIAAFQRAVNYIQSGLERLFSGISRVASAIMQLFGTPMHSPLVSFSMPKYASGGFPEDGLFFANHGEMVGQFSNGQTAVANNEQIVEGIKRGVFEAMSSAMSVGGNGQSHTTEININGRQFFRAVWDDYKAVAREHGVKLVNNV